MYVSASESYHLRPAGLKSLDAAFGDRLRKRVPLARYTAARIGGPADLLIEAESVEELIQAAQLLWKEKAAFLVLGGGSNVLVSDAGVRGVVVLNRARSVRFETSTVSPTVWAEAGANFGVIARQAAVRGLSGLEWAAGIPGTLGGAVIGNAGAHGGDMSGNLLVADILHQKRGREQWSVEQFDYQYRSSVLKHRQPGTAAPEAVVLEARLRLVNSSPPAVQAKIDEYVAHRRRTQPPGASMGSMFKNPPGDFAGRLIEAAGLKGTRVGEAQISTLHANFFINLGSATAGDVYALIQLARRSVEEKFGISLDLEIELVGDWVNP